MTGACLSDMEALPNLGSEERGTLEPLGAPVDPEEGAEGGMSPAPGAPPPRHALTPPTPGPLRLPLEHRAPVPPPPTPPPDPPPAPL